MLYVLRTSKGIIGTKDATLYELMLEDARYSVFDNYELENLGKDIDSDWVYAVGGNGDKILGYTSCFADVDAVEATDWENIRVLSSKNELDAYLNDASVTTSSARHSVKRANRITA